MIDLCWSGLLESLIIKSLQFMCVKLIDIAVNLEGANQSCEICLDYVHWMIDSLLWTANGL